MSNPEDKMPPRDVLPRRSWVNTHRTAGRHVNFVAQPEKTPAVSDMYNRAHAFLLLTNLGEKSDVYQVTMFKQLTRWAVVITLKQKVTQPKREWMRARIGLAAIGFPQQTQVEGDLALAVTDAPEPRTITAWGNTPHHALINASTEYEQRTQRVKEKENNEQDQSYRPSGTDSCAGGSGLHWVPEQQGPSSES